MEIEVDPAVWITLADGTRLAAKIWRPAAEGEYPVVLEFLPYRRGDGTAPRDDSTYPAYAAEGIIGVRVDSRGNGDSDGLFDDEYSPLELSDICEVIAWIAEQPWSNGAVGMMGISWGGFNGLQTAALRPPALKAVISIASTVDRYNDDIHYKGGCLLSANVYWAGTMLSYASRPPDPDVVGNRWAEIWRERLAAEPMLLETWLRHGRRDAYWHHGSICEDWSAIQCPVWVIAGWADGYRNCPATLATHATAPVKATTGPWVHKYPHFALPRPRLDFLAKSIAWWKRWLCDEATGVEDWPDYQAFIMEDARPMRWRGSENGRWIGTTWPRNDPPLELSLGADGVLGSGKVGAIRVSSPQHCGVTSGEYFTLKPDAEMPGDQRPDDAWSACWETPPQGADLDLLGRPQVDLEVSIDQPQGNLIARLIDVHPDGTSTLITRGVLNLCHRGGNSKPNPMVPGQAERITLALDETGYRVLAGHRLRLAISTAYWPYILPSPAPVTAEIAAGEGSVLTLPRAEGLQEVADPESADEAPLKVHPDIREGHSHRDVSHDLTRGVVCYRIDEDSGVSENPHNGMLSRDTRLETWEIAPDDPLSLRGNLSFEAERQRGAWKTATLSEITFTCTATTYDVVASVVAFEGETEFHRKDWSFSVPRDHM